LSAVSRGDPPAAYSFLILKQRSAANGTTAFAEIAKRIDQSSFKRCDQFNVELKVVTWHRPFPYHSGRLNGAGYISVVMPEVRTVDGSSRRYGV